MCEADQIILHEIVRDKYDFNEIFSDVTQLYNTSNYVVANLETPIAGKELVYCNRKWSFNAPIEFAEAVKRSGVDLVSTANNHCLDRGIEGLKNTLKALDKCELKHIGTYADKETKNYLIEDIQGIKIAFLSYTYGTNAFANHNYLSKDEKFMVNLFQEQELSNWISRMCFNNTDKLYSKVYRKLGRILYPKQFKIPVYERKESSRRCKKQLLRDLQECKESGAEFIIMCMHAGGQYNNQPTGYTKELCDFLIKHGVNAIIGHHEHVIHSCDMSRINENIIKTYSLGNFSGKAGVTKEPYDKMAEYSICFNIYLSRQKNKVTVDTCTFTIAKSIPFDGNKIKTVLLYDLINLCENEDEKKRLLNDNLKVINTFLKSNLQNVEIKKEYDVKYLLSIE